MKSFSIVLGALFVLLLSSCLEQGPLEIEINEGVDTISLNGTFSDAFATSNYGSIEIIHNDVDVTNVGTYRVIYEATSGDQSVQAVRYVVVVDQEPPEITLLPGKDTICQGDPWVDAGVRVTDNSFEAVELDVSGNVNTSMEGRYVITYEATDLYGNVAVSYRHVYVNACSDSSWILE
jgi:hypothetical protein